MLKSKTQKMFSHLYLAKRENISVFFLKVLGKRIGQMQNKTREIIPAFMVPSIQNLVYTQWKTLFSFKTAFNLNIMVL